MFLTLDLELPVEVITSANKTDMDVFITMIKNYTYSASSEFNVETFSTRVKLICSGLGAQRIWRAYQALLVK